MAARCGSRPLTTLPARRHSSSLCPAAHPAETPPLLAEPLRRIACSHLICAHPTVHARCAGRDSRGRRSNTSDRARAPTRAGGGSVRCGAGEAGDRGRSRKRAQEAARHLAELERENERLGQLVPLREAHRSRLVALFERWNGPAPALRMVLKYTCVPAALTLENALREWEKTASL